MHFGWIGADDFQGEGFTAIPLAVEAATPIEAVEKAKAFLEEVAELAEAHPGVELLDGVRAINALTVVRTTRVAARQHELAERGKRQ